MSKQIELKAATGLSEAIISSLQGAREHRTRFGRPMVTLSYAQSLDGSLALERGRSTLISGQQSLELTHTLRAAHDAILVGIGTVLADDPKLTVRAVQGKDPQPVVLDSQLRFPLNARLLQHDPKPWIFTSQTAVEKTVKSLQNVGAVIFRAPLREDRIDLAVVLEKLAAERVDSLMVEGGGQVIAAFLKAQLADLAVITLAPLFIGGYKVLETPLTDAKAQDVFPRLSAAQMERFGDDFVVWGWLANEAS